MSERNAHLVARVRKHPDLKILLTAFTDAKTHRLRGLARKKLLAALKVK